MNITLVTETYPPEVNGVSMTLHRLVRGLMSRGNTLEVVRPRQGNDDHPGANGSSEVLTRGLPIPGYPELRFGLPAGLRLARLWRANRPDVVHVATEGPLGLTAIRTARKQGIPVSSSFHTNFHTYTAHYRLYGLGIFQKIALAYLRMAHNLTRRTFVPSHTMVGLLQKSGFRNVRILGRGVDTELFDPSRRNTDLRRSWGADDDTPVAIYVGRLAAEKNVPLVAEAFLAMREIRPEMRLVLVGDGPARAQLERSLPDGTHFAGLRRGEDLATHYASGDLFLFPSTTETFGNVTTEAMASGLAVLAYDYAAARQHIVDGKNGRAVPFDDREAYLAVAREMAANSRDWPALRQAARDTALDITWDRIVGQFEDELRLISGDNSRS